MDELKAYKRYKKAKKSIRDLTLAYNELGKLIDNIEKYKNYSIISETLLILYANASLVEIQIQGLKQVVKQYETRKILLNEQ